MKKGQYKIAIKNYVFALKGVEGAYLGEKSTHAPIEEAVYFSKKPYDFLQARQVLYNCHPDTNLAYWNYDVEEVTVYLKEADYDRPKRKRRKS